MRPDLYNKEIRLPREYTSRRNYHNYFTTFDEIEVGTWFTVDGQYFIKTRDYDSVNAVGMDGDLYCFEEDTKVFAGKIDF